MKHIDEHNPRPKSEEKILVSFLTYFPILFILLVKHKTQKYFLPCSLRGTTALYSETSKIHLLETRQTKNSDKYVQIGEFMYNKKLPEQFPSDKSENFLSKYPSGIQSKLLYG